MAYENEKNRLAAIITNTVGISRVRDSDLEREATERALEARQQVGLNYVGEESKIKHPTPEERRSRLGAPSSLYTAELATWNYLWNDPVDAAANGLLNSPDHRSVLDNAFYDNWGLGIYTEMPQGQTNELHRRWYFILWLSDKPVGSSVQSQPSETFSPTKRVSFGVGVHHAYVFNYEGAILSSKTISVTRNSSAQARGRGRIPNREGNWLLIDNGNFANMWVREEAFVASANREKLV